MAACDDMGCERMCDACIAGVSHRRTLLRSVGGGKPYAGVVGEVILNVDAVVPDGRVYGEFSSRASGGTHAEVLVLRSPDVVLSGMAGTP